jgi:hypothetical protein
MSINTPDTCLTPGQGQLVSGFVPSERGLALWSHPCKHARTLDPHFENA